MSVAKEGQRVIRDKAVDVGGFHEVFIFVHRGTMNQTEVLHGYWPNRERRQIAPVLVCENLGSPQSGGLSNGVEPLEIGQADGGFVVIASHNGRIRSPTP